MIASTSQTRVSGWLALSGSRAVCALRAHHALDGVARVVRGEAQPLVEVRLLHVEHGKRGGGATVLGVCQVLPQTGQGTS